MNVEVSRGFALGIAVMARKSLVDDSMGIAEVTAGWRVGFRFGVNLDSISAGFRRIGQRINDLFGVLKRIGPTDMETVFFDEKFSVGRLSDQIASIGTI